MEGELTDRQLALGTYLVGVSQRPDLTANRVAAEVMAARQLGINNLANCRLERLLFIQGDLSHHVVADLSAKLLVDPVTESYTITPLETSKQGVFHFKGKMAKPAGAHHVDVTFLPGVTDAAADNLVQAAHRLGHAGLRQAATGQRYWLEGDLGQDDLETLATKLLSNPVIQRVTIDEPITPPFVTAMPPDGTVEMIEIREAEDDELLAISQERRLALDLAEMQTVQRYYRKEGRDPTDVEMEMLAQTWSEHCVHKTFKARINYTGPDGQQIQVNGLLNDYIRAATETVNRDWVHSAFVDDAGIVAFDDTYDVAFKVETHNHPSALEPFGGANTGIGGVVRDVLGVSARPIANTDILCFGHPDLPAESLPAGVLHPARIADGVVHGIEDYGNKMGIPTVNGSIRYHNGYTANPLVYCGCLGILPRGSHPTEVQAGDLIIAIGGRTGRDGLRGATFSSMEMDTETSELSGSAVQIGNPIQEKQVLELILKARDEQLYNALTDCGAGGFSSSVGEMGESVGARVQLQAAPLKYPGLRPWEIWLSEAQERMVLAVPPEKWDRLQALAAGQDVEAVCIGTFEPTGRLQLFYGDTLVGDLSMDFLHDGIPQRKLTGAWARPNLPEQLVGEPQFDLAGSLLAILAHPNVRSKEAVVRRYDHEVQGGTVVKPLVGVANHGPGDAAVLWPLATQRDGQTSAPGIALGNGICPEFGELDPYNMAWAAVDEAVRNVVAVGADPDRIAILDNFCWGNPNLPDRLGALVRCAQGCHDAAVAYNTPYVSGKDSLNNEYTGGDGEKHAIPGTILISSMGHVPDVGRSMTMDLKNVGSRLFVVGETAAEMGGSHYGLVNGLRGGSVPAPNARAKMLFTSLHEAILAGELAAVHDCAEGGIAVTLAEMCLAGNIGVQIDVAGLTQSLTATELLFAESLSRFVVEVVPGQASAFTNRMKQAAVPTHELGQTTKSGFLAMAGSELLIDIEIDSLDEAFRGHIDGRAPLASPAPTPLPKKAATPLLKQPRVLILHANGTNRDREAALACEQAGGVPEIVHVNQLFSGERSLADYQMLVLPGGFSYGDDLGAGILWSVDLGNRLWDDVKDFVLSDRPVLGICNGFQALVKAGILPGKVTNGKRDVTLTYNERGHFECRWVYLQPNQACSNLFLTDVTEPIYCPVAHGEGRIAVRSENGGQKLVDMNLIALQYGVSREDDIAYPGNPNGSWQDIAGLSNEAGNVLGLMPHPEDHIFAWQHPRRHRGEMGLSGLPLFRSGIRHA